MIKKMLVGAASLAAMLAFSVAQAEVARTIVTTGISEREPVNDLQRIPSTDERVYFFTDLRDMAGTSITHVWKHNGEVKAEVKFDIGGPRWRVWSSKNMLPEWTGDWTVEIVDDSGKVIATKAFSYAAVSTVEEPVTEDAAEPVQQPAPADEAGESTGSTGESSMEKEGMEPATEQSQ